MIGAVFNYIGGMSILSSMFTTIPYSFPKLPGRHEINPDDYVLYRLFAVGTAFCFGSLYLYLYVRPQYAFPFLLFGMALKYWAFAASVIAHLKFRLPMPVLIVFGFGNLLVALMFSFYLLFR